MARGGRPGKKRTQYVRDAQGQFASTPGGGKKATPSAVRKAARAAALRGGTLAARTSLKKSRSKLAGIDKADQTLQTSLSKRAQKGAVTRGSKNLTKAIKSSRTRLIGAKPNANTIKKKRPVSMAYVLKDVTRSMSSDDAQRVLGKKPLAKRKISAPSKANTIKKKRNPILEAKPLQKPASQRPGSMTATLRGALKSLAQADAQRIREIESITGQKLKPIKERAAAVGDRIRSAAKGGKVASTLKAGLRELAQSDARTMRGMAEIVRDATPKVSGGKSGKALKGAKKALPAAKSTEPSPVQRRRTTVVPALQGSNKLAPLSPQRRKVANRAGARNSSLNELAIKAKKELKKAQNKAMSANNPYSDMTPKARKTALTRLKKAEEADAKIRKSQMTTIRAKSFAEGMAGATKQGYTRYDNAVRRSDIRTPKAKPPKPTTRIKGSRTTLPRTPGTVAKAKRGKVRPDANPKPAVLPITSERRKPLKGIGAAIKGNLRGWTGLPVEIRSRKRSAAAQRYRSNELGKKVAASIGFNQAVSQRKTFAESSKRIVFKRGNMRQFNLFGGIQKVGGGRFKPVGERMASGRVYQPKYTRPLANSKTRKKEIERLINNNNGKAVAAFYL